MRSGSAPVRSTRLTAETTGCSGACSFSCSGGHELVEHQRAATPCRSRSARADPPASARANSASTFATVSPSSSFVPFRPKRRASLSNTRRPSSTARSFSSAWIRCLILLRAREVATKFSQSRLGLCAALRDDLDDVAVLEAGAQRHHAAVDARADALVADVGVNRVREIDRRRAPRQHLDRAARREGVDLFGIEIDLEVGEELLRVADFLLPLEQLPQPLEVLLVAPRADAAFLVLPVRGDAFLGDPVHLFGADLDLERKALLADHRGVQRLVDVGPRHGDEVLDAAGHRRPRLVDDAERGVAVLHRAA